MPATVQETTEQNVTNGQQEQKPVSPAPTTNQWPEDVGILSIEMYFPNTYVDQAELEKHDKVGEGKYTIGLGQTRMGFADDSEDIQSICLTVVKRLLEKTRVSPKRIGFLMVGTETLIDKSKSVKTTLMQLFEDCDNHEIEGIDTINACYGGTAALFAAANWIESSSWDGRYAIVVAADLAVYSAGVARPTGGAGACALLIGPNSPLVITRGVKATYMTHVYDFYKPNLESEYPVVDGKLSITCYLKAVDKCYALFKERLKRVSLKEKLDLNYFDGLLFHSPFCKLVQKSVARLLFNEFLADDSEEARETYKDCEKFRKLSQEDSYSDKELEKRFVELSKELFEEKTKASLLLASEVGNMYTASLYSCLVSYLISKPIDEIAGQNLLLFSYGSGAAATMFSLSISSDGSRGSPLHRCVSSIAHCKDTLAKRIKVDPEEFTKIMEHKEKTHHVAPHTPEVKLERIQNGAYYLEKKDDQHKRTYKRKPLSAAQVSQSAAALLID